MNPNKENILSVYNRATDSEYRSGLTWYASAHSEAIAMGDTVKASGVIAALSPMLSWDRNIVLAHEAMASGTAQGCLGSSCAKANRIIAGESPLDVLGGDKVRNFYMNIAEPYNMDAVTIDRHAYDIALGLRHKDNNRPNLKGKRYELFANIYREAAREVGLYPSQVQAITWNVWRSTYAWTRNKK